MEKLFNYDNVFIDSASGYKINEVHERSYLSSLFGEIKNLFSSDFLKFRFYVLFSHIPEAYPASSSFDHPNKVLFWFSEESGAMPLHLKNCYKFIFKSYIKSEQDNIYTTPLGHVNEFRNEDELEKPSKELSLFFSGNLNANRYELYKMFFFMKYPISKLFNKLSFSIPGIFFFRLNVTNLSSRKFKSVVLFSKMFKGGLQYEDYLTYLRKSKFVICPKGFQSNETFRHIEAMASGCILISEPLPDVYLNQNNPFITYNTIDELKEVITRIHQNEYDENDLASKTYSYYLKNFSTKSVAEKVKEVCLNSDKKIK
jgi:hypothetical protein